MRLSSSHFNPTQKILPNLRLKSSLSQNPNKNPQNPPWISSNKLFQKHPRLLPLQNCKNLNSLNPIFAYTIISGLFLNPFVASRILHCFLQNPLFPPPKPYLAFSIFSQISRPNVFSWNTMIKSLQWSSACSVSMFVEMRRKGVLIDEYTIPFLLMSFCSIDDIYCGRSVHGFCFVFGFGFDVFVQTRLVSMYMDCGDGVDARKVFDEMPVKDVVVWTSVISGLVRLGLYEEGFRVFNRMRNCDSSVRPNSVTMVSAMSACSSLGSLNRAKNLHSCFVKTGFESYVFVANSLIDCYGKCGSVACAHEVFDGMSEKDLRSWTSMIMSLALNGHGQDAILLFWRMIRDGLLPDSTTFVAVLSACSHAGLVDEGIEIFESMEGVFGIRPELIHYGCMVDIFARAGHLRRAYEFILRMPMEPNSGILSALLSACSVHGDLELGELISSRIDSSLHRCSGVSVILSNLYANSEQWRDVILIRRGRKEEGSKPPGQSWIEIRGVVQEFVAGDRVHPLAKKIELVLNGLAKAMEQVI